MSVAAISAHASNGLFSTAKGIEVPLLIVIGVAAIALAGAGGFSLDALFGIGRFWTAGWFEVALMVGLPGGIGNVTTRRPRNPVRS